MHDPKVIHHMHKRKRIHVNKEPYPHPDRFKRLIDTAIYLIATIGPILTLPQIWKIWVYKNAAGVSFLSWLAYLIGAFFWLLYGIIHKEKPIIFANIIWIVLDFVIVLGVALYGSGFL